MAAKKSYMLPGHASSFKPPKKHTLAPAQTSSYKPPTANSGFKLHGGPIKQTTNNPVPNPKPAPQPKPPAASAPAVNPFLNADQQGALNNAWSDYHFGTIADNAKIGDANVDYTSTLQQDAKTAKVNTSAENNNAAARGLFHSSIRDGALNDIAATQANNDNIALINLGRLVGSLNADISRLATNWGIAQGTAFGEAIENAQNTPPPPPPPAAPNPNAQTPPSASPNAGYIHRVQNNPTNWRPKWAQQQQNKHNKQVARHRMAGARTSAYKGGR